LLITGRFSHIGEFPVRGGRHSGAFPEGNGRFRLAFRYHMRLNALPHEPDPLDTVTQALLGAAVGQATVSRAGRRAILIGAAAGVLPDLDVITSPFLTEVDAFVTHRSATHSFVVMPVVAALIALAAPRLRGGLGLTQGEWLRLLLACFATHILVDLCTSYGTQILWPLSDHPFAWSIVFIIDPVYSLTLVAGLAFAWFAHEERGRLLSCGLAVCLSSLYLVAAAGLKMQAAVTFRDELEARGIPAEVFKVQNTPFNVVLWHALAAGDGFITDGYCFSPCDPDGVEFRVRRMSPHREAVDAWIPEFDELRKLAEFSKGFYEIREDEGRLVLVDRRFGSGNIRPFAYQVGRLGEDGPERIGDVAPRVGLARPGDLERELKAFLGRWR